MKLKKFSDFKKELMKDPEFRKAYDALEPEFALIASVIRKRLKKEMTQAQLAKKVGTKQSAIARLESGSSNPSMAFLGKVASALDARLHVVLK